MEFPELLKRETLETYAKRESSKVLGEAERKKKLGSATRVTVRYLDDLRKEIHSRELTWYSDASKTDGGKGEHPGALQHFLAGLPLCQMTHYAERASVWGLHLDDLEMSVTGHFLAAPGHGFDEIEYEARIVSQEDQQRVKELAVAAATDCYVTNTLKKACKITGKIFLNGQLLMETKD